MKVWILFFIGTLAYFLYKYINRSRKTIGFSLKYWARDNWAELTLAFIVDFGMALVFLDKAIDFEQVSWIPAWLSSDGALQLFAFFLGYGGGVIVYNILKKKVKDAKVD
jgi:hypothetical protein